MGGLTHTAEAERVIMKGERMKSYRVKITETLNRTVAVEACDSEEALDKVRDAWRASEIVLGAEDFLEVMFEAVRQHTDRACPAKGL